MCMMDRDALSNELRVSCSLFSQVKEMQHHVNTPAWRHEIFWLIMWYSINTPVQGLDAWPLSSYVALPYIANAPAMGDSYAHEGAL
jgi:hypothetical protein